MAFNDDAAGDALAETELPPDAFVWDGIFDAAFAECADDADDCDINQFRRYGSRFVVDVVAVPMPKID